MCVVATFVRMASSHRDGASLKLASIVSCCCVAVISALNSAMLSLLRCTVALLAMLKLEKPLRS